LNIPVAVAAIVVAWCHIEESAEGEARLDWFGALLACAALGALAWGLTLWSSHHALSVGAGAGLGVGLVLLALFVMTERRLGEQAMMPLLLFGSRRFVGLTVLTFMLYGALGGLLVLLPYLLIVGGAYSPTQAGFALLPFSIVIGVASRLTGRLTGRIGARWPLTMGPLITGSGFWLLVGADPHARYVTSILPGVAVIAFGMAWAVAPLTTAVLASVDQRHTGTASGFNSAIARTGGLVATALASAVLAENGAALTHAFHMAAIVAGAFALASGLVAFCTLDD
jgi:predicted MFS family arabinose efflux permease